MGKDFPRRLAAAMLLAASLAACAAEPLPPQDRPEAFRKLDTDRDGWISRSEAAANPVVSADFTKADRDGDGRLSLEEFEAIPLNRSDQPGRFQTPERG